MVYYIHTILFIQFGTALKHNTASKTNFTSFRNEAFSNYFPSSGKITTICVSSYSIEVCSNPVNIVGGMP